MIWIVFLAMPDRLPARRALSMDSLRPSCRSGPDRFRLLIEVLLDLVSPLRFIWLSYRVAMVAESCQNRLA